MLKSYDKYALDVVSGNIVAGELIKLSCQQYLNLKQDIRYEFREKTVDKVIKFIALLKHFTGSHAGKHFILEPWQTWIIARIFGFYYRGTNKRLTKEAYIQIARKNGKDALVAAIALYMLIAEGEMSAEIDGAANSRDQAQILFTMCKYFAETLDPKGTILKQYRNQLKFPTTKSIINCFASDSTKLDGFNSSCYILDEIHCMLNPDLYNVLKSSTGMRDNPLGILITSSGFDFTSLAYNIRNVQIEILKGLKTDDSQFAAIYEIDADDDWTNPDVWIKANPNLNVTIKSDFIREQVLQAQNNPSLETGVRTKHLNEWVSSSNVWIPDKYIINSMQDIDLKQFNDCIGFIGIDLSSVSDLTAVTLLVPQDYKFYFKTWYFLPQETVYNSANSDKYREYVRNKELIVTPGNVVDYDIILKYIIDLTNLGILIESISFDRWNSTQLIINATNAGLNCIPYSQSIGSFNKPTKEFERLIKEGKVILDKNSVTRWCFGNATLKEDYNFNQKPVKTSANQKIDGTISILQALGGYLECPQYSYNI